MDGGVTSLEAGEGVIVLLTVGSDISYPDVEINPLKFLNQSQHSIGYQTIAQSSLTSEWCQLKQITP